MLPTPLNGNDRDPMQPRTGHGAASVIPRLKEENSRCESTDAQEAPEEPQGREAQRPQPLSIPSIKYP